MLTVSADLKAAFETFGKLPAEDLNNDFLKAAASLIENKMDFDSETEFSVQLVNSEVKIAVFITALWLSENRDFMNRLDAEAVSLQVDRILSHRINLSRYLRPNEGNNYARPVYPIVRIQISRNTLHFSRRAKP